MDSTQGSSFIPKSPVRGAVKQRGVRKVYVFTYLIFIFFFGTMIASAVTFAYGFTVNTQLEQAKQSLLEERNSFSQSNFEQVKEFDVRSKTAYAIFNRHVSLVNVLAALETTTLATVQLTEFSFEKDEEGALMLSLGAKMADFNAALFQREMFTGSSVLRGSRLSEVSVVDVTKVEESKETAEVTFVIKKEFEVSDIAYDPSTYIKATPATELESLLNFNDSDVTELTLPSEPEVVNEEL